MTEEIEQVQVLAEKATEFFVQYSFQVVGAIIILIIGFLVAGWLSKISLKLFEKRKLDVTLSHFLASIIKGLVIVFAVIIAMGKFGITIAPFIAALGAIAFGATYAVQGPLSNYGAGVAIVLGRPFVVGDTIDVAGVAGVVEEVRLANTRLTDEDGVSITIPNKHIVGEILQNSKEYRIVESVVGISYDDEPEQAIQAVKQTLETFDDVAEEPPPQVGIEAFGDSSVNIGYRYWVPTKKFFQTQHVVNLAVYKAIKAAGITIPFPQQDVTVKKLET
jgi:small conductance mechanosensitive channel